MTVNSLVLYRCVKSVILTIYLPLRVVVAQQEVVLFQAQQVQPQVQVQEEPLALSAF